MESFWVIVENLNLELFAKKVQFVNYKILFSKTKLSQLAAFISNNLVISCFRGFICVADILSSFVHKVERFFFAV